MIDLVYISEDGLYLEFDTVNTTMREEYPDGNYTYQITVTEKVTGMVVPITIPFTVNLYYHDCGNVEVNSIIISDIEAQVMSISYTPGDGLGAVAVPAMSDTESLDFFTDGLCGPIDYELSIVTVSSVSAGEDCGSRFFLEQSSLRVIFEFTDGEEDLHCQGSAFIIQI